MQLVDFKTAENLVKKYKIPHPSYVFVLTKKEALSVAKKIKYPVFLKAYGKKILNKIEMGGVKEIATPTDLRKVFLKMRNIKGVDGIIVQRKIIGKSLILGMKNDPQFGPIIMVGAGGTFAEIINDVSLRVAPISEK